MSLLRFFEWLATTPGSIALHDSLYVYQIVSTVHVVTLSLFVGTAVMLDLRLLGATHAARPRLGGRGAASAVDRRQAFC